MYYERYFQILENPRGKSSYWEDVTEKSWSIFQILIFSPFYHVVLTNLKTPVSSKTLTGALQNYSGNQSNRTSLLQIFSIVKVSTVFSNWTPVQLFKVRSPLGAKTQDGTQKLYNSWRRHRNVTKLMEPGNKCFISKVQTLMSSICVCVI